MNVEKRRAIDRRQNLASLVFIVVVSRYFSRCLEGRREGARGWKKFPSRGEKMSEFILDAGRYLQYPARREIGIGQRANEKRPWTNEIKHARQGRRWWE